MELCKGVAFIIDNQIGNDEQVIKIIKKIHEKGIPTSEFNNLESAEKSLDNMIMANFIILDWKMFDFLEKDSGIVRPGAVARENAIQQVIDFIKKIKTVCFAPIFIFTTDSEDDIEDQIIPKLRDENLYFDEEKRNFIHVRNKSEILKYNRLFKNIDKWILSTPSIYVLKSWQKEFLKAQNEVFWELYNKSPSWPKILWESFQEEGEDPNSCMNETLFRLTITKIMLNMDKKTITKPRIKPDPNEIKEVIQRTRFQEKDSLHGIKPGDVYRKQGKYYLNIRPECDTVEGRDHYSKNIYLIKGEKISTTNLKKIHHKHGFVPRINEALVFFLDGKDAVKFDFKSFSVKEFEKFKDIRICRLLPPYITDIQHKFASFIGRLGVPRLPKQIENEILRR